jgi:hypothetical protein
MPAGRKSKHFFKKSDFESKRCLVVMRNITTSTDLPKGQNPELAEIGKSDLSMLIPAGACSEGHLLLLRFFEEQEYEKIRNAPRSVQDKAQLLAVTAKVTRLDPAADQKCLAVLDLQQYVDKEWQELLKSLSEAQDKVSKLVKRIKH